MLGVWSADIVPGPTYGEADSSMSERSGHYLHICTDLVQDNLHTHACASLYEAVLPAEACRLAQRLEIHYTPKHGSWLNRADTERSIWPRPCLDRRRDAPAVVREEVSSGEAERHEVKATLNGRFTVADARVKLKHVYPSIEI